MVEKSFYQRVWNVVSTVPKGKVTTYRDVAHVMGSRAYRAVGQAMNKNPHPHTKVPCHRVVGANGLLGGFAWDINLKVERLRREGVKVEDGKIVDFEKKLHRFSFIL